MMHNIKELIKDTKEMKLLYVEDNKDMREQTCKLFGSFFDDITIAIDGQDGLDKFHKNTFDIVITDINMPKINGIEMLKNMRNSNASMPCIIMSAYNETEYFIEAIKLGIDGYILKPLDMDIFTYILKRIIKLIKLEQTNKYYMTTLEKQVNEKTKELEHKLYYDDLTGLKNRYSLVEEISTHKENNIPVVIMLDIDSLKTYNELYGIESGNDVLIQCSKCLKELAKGSGFNVYRLTSDEFVLFSKVQSIDVEKYEKIIYSIFNFFAKNKLFLKSINERVEISITIGMAFGDNNTLAKANSALYEAKKDEKKFAIYTEENSIKRQLKNTLYWKGEIKNALKNGNIIPYFQPIVDRNQKVIKYEALMRLRQYDEYGKHKIVSPLNFLEISLQTKQYDDLSYSMLEKTMLNAIDKNISFSINLDFRDIYNKKLIKMLKENIVKFYDVNQGNSNKIILEILENHEIQDYSSFANKLLDLQNLGALIAIDDFGSGYSNLTHIMGLSPHYVKIDGSLIKNITTDKKSQKIVQSLVQLAKNLGIKTIAEFVATKSIFDVVYDLGIDEFQGYYFAEPMSLEQLNL